MGGFLYDVSKGNTGEVRAWLENGQEVDKADTYGNTALLLAAEKGFLPVCQLLIEFGAEPNHSNTAVGWGALHFAAYEGHTEVIKLLLDCGADPDKVDNSGDTPESWADEWGNTACAQILREATQRRKNQCNHQTVPPKASKLNDMDQNGNKNLEANKEKVKMDVPSPPPATSFSAAAPPPPPPPPPPPQPALITSSITTSHNSKGKFKHPLTGGAEPDMHESLMDEIRAFAKGSSKRRPSSKNRVQDKKEAKNNLTLETTKVEAMIQKSIQKNSTFEEEPKIQYEAKNISEKPQSKQNSSNIKFAEPVLKDKSTTSDVPVSKDLASHLMSLSSANISQELKKSCSNIMALSANKESNSEKDFLLKRLEELINQEKKQVNADLIARREQLSDTKDSQQNDLAFLENKQNKEMTDMKKRHEQELLFIEDAFIDQCDQLQREIELLENELESMSAPSQILSTIVNAEGPSRTPTPLKSDLTELECELQCCHCGRICQPPTKIYQCPEGDLLCQDCKDLPGLTDCPDCGVSLAGQVSRNKVLENIASKYFQK